MAHKQRNEFNPRNLRASGRMVSPGGNFVVTYGHIGRFKKAAEPHQHADATAGARAQGSVAGFKGLRPPAAGPFFFSCWLLAAGFWFLVGG